MNPPRRAINKIRLIIGIAIWISVALFVAHRYANYWGRSSDNALQKIGRFVFKPRHQYELKFDGHQWVQIGDPIFKFDSQNRLVQIGAVRQVESPDSKEYVAVRTNWASASMFSNAPEIQPGDFLTYHVTPESMDWVVTFMLPADKRREIAALIASTLEENSAEIMGELLPILQQSLDQTSVIVREELISAIARRHEQWQEIGERYRREMIEQQVIPLVNDEIWPIVQQNSQPLLEEVGEEIWKRASIWRFGWRSVYDAMPLPEQNLTQREFARFVEQDAVPVLRAYLPAFIELQQQVLVQAANNQRVQEVLKSSLQQIANDTELQSLVLDILREVFLQNERLRQALEDIWNSPDAQRVLKLADARLEPAVVQIGEQLFGSPTGGVTAEFARILRNKILKKDSRWLILRNSNEATSELPSDPDTLVVVTDDAAMHNPFFKPAKDR